jgi:3',5'-cyclic AMP phosphodiesterase CpdA
MTRVFHVSDIHFGLEDRAALDWVADCVARERPAAVVITGDITMRARRREFAAASRWVRALDVPVTVEVGNHDLPYFNLAERFLDPYRRFDALKAAVERTVALPGAAIVPLKTTARAQPRLDWSKGRVGDRSLAACLAAIDALPPGTRALIACHHPLVEAGTRGRALTHGGENALAQLARRGVLAVLSGHVHDAFDIVHHTANGPVRMIGAGTLSQRVRSTPAGFNELIFEDGTIAVTVRAMGRAMGTAAAAPPITDNVPEDAEPPRDAAWQP